MIDNHEKINTSKYFSKVPFNSGQLINGHLIYLKVKRVRFLEQIKNWQFSYLLKNDPLKTSGNYIDSLKSLIPIYAFAGVCFIMFILTFSFFLYFREKQYIFYGIYLLIIFTYLCGDIFGINAALFGEQHYSQYWFSQELQMLLNISYAYFVILFIKAKEDYYPIHITVIILISVQALCIVVDSYFLYHREFSMHLYTMHFQRAVLFAAGLYGNIYAIVYKKNYLTYYVSAGVIVYVMAFIGQFYLINSGEVGQLFKNNNYYLIISFTLEIIIFAFGFTYKILLEHKEKLGFQHEAFINKTKALRAQVNPHFIFNALNSIQHLVISDNRSSALKYLSRFTRLTHNILESSIETNVLLNEEIIMTQDYLELESLRFDNAFSYAINIEDTLDVNTVEMPFMILQPFVENALIHGLLPKETGIKELVINFKKKDDIVICEVEDSGIGRQAASKRKHIYQKEKKSRGLEVTKQRLEFLSDDSENIEIVDIIDADGKSQGTKVIIKIPLQTDRTAISEKHF